MSAATTSTVTLTPAEEEKANHDHLLTAFVNVCSVPHAAAQRHPLCLSFNHNGIVHFLGSFIHVTAANVNSPQHMKAGALVLLEMMTLRALLALLSPHVAHAVWRHQHPGEHSRTVQEFPQLRAQSHARNCPMRFSLVQERRSFKLEQDGQAKCTRLQAFSGSQQLG